jgi:hypothetical protein
MTPFAPSTRLSYARVAGVAYILIIVIGLLSGTLIDSKLVVPGNDALTARNIIANERLFRIGIAGAVVMYAGVLVLSAALYVVLEEVNRPLALLGMLLRAAEAVVGLGTVILAFAPLALFGPGDRPMAPTMELWYALAGVSADVKNAALDLILFLVGLGGTVFSYLFFVSRYVPRALAAWGIFSYSSILVLALVSIMVPAFPVIVEAVLYAMGGAFELAFGFWLVFKGVRVEANVGAPAS